MTTQPDMTGFYPEDYNRASYVADAFTDGTSSDGGRIPSSPNVHHPRFDPDGAFRVLHRLDEDRLTLNDLSAREWGLLAYWYSSVLFAAGGSDE